MAPFCPHPPWEGRSCAQVLVSSCPHSCPYFPFLVPRCCWLVYGNLQAPGSSSAMLLGHQPLPQVSMSPGYSKDPWLPPHLPLKTNACRLQHPYQLTRYPWSSWGKLSRAPLHVQGKSASPSAWAKVPSVPWRKNPASPSGLGSDPLGRKVENKTEVEEIRKNKFPNPDCDGDIPPPLLTQKNVSSLFFSLFFLNELTFYPRQHPIKLSILC